MPCSSSATRLALIPDMTGLNNVRGPTEKPRSTMRFGMESQTVMRRGNVAVKQRHSCRALTSPACAMNGRKRNAYAKTPAGTHVNASGKKSARVRPRYPITYGPAMVIKPACAKPENTTTAAIRKMTLFLVRMVINAKGAVTASHRNCGSALVTAVSGKRHCKKTNFMTEAIEASTTRALSGINAANGITNAIATTEPPMVTATAGARSLGLVTTSLVQANMTPFVSKMPRSGRIISIGQKLAPRKTLAARHKGGNNANHAFTRKHVLRPTLSLYAPRASAMYQDVKLDTPPATP
mmetsp:Transcript_78068/g.143526  ORF Transcript_78068/g.143526 Transcript_78068/m.143526 type:complete len:295 (+) Transcript_78068:364-1248(+)